MVFPPQSKTGMENQATMPTPSPGGSAYSAATSALRPSITARRLIVPLSEI
jgi:hypothetical protein